MEASSAGRAGASGGGGGDGNKVSSQAFYREWHGHKVEHLEQVLPALRARSDRLIWTAGDSSLDNKYWFSDVAPAVGSYQNVLQPPTMKKDVTYWLNYHCQQEPRSSTSSNRGIRQASTAAINTAVEATTLNERTFRMRPQDIFLRDNISSDDILVVSVGGNDVALCPLPCTITALGCLVCLPKSCVKPCIVNGRTCGTVPFDDCCCGCGPSLCSCACGCPPCLGFVRHYFGTRLQKYIEALTSKTKPAKVLVCMLYYPDECSDKPSWASPSLGVLGYNSRPSTVQAFIRKVYTEAIGNVRVPGTQVITVPLFNVLDGKNTADYVARVEPSPTGGSKMAELLLDLIDNADSLSSGSVPAPPSAPSSALIQDRG